MKEFSTGMRGGCCSWSLGLSAQCSRSCTHCSFTQALEAKPLC